MKRHLMPWSFFLCLFLLLASQPQMVLCAPAGPSLAKYVRPDGRIDLKAIRASGYQGPLDLKGFDVRLDRRSGAPLARPAGGVVLEDPDDQYWSAGFNVPGLGEYPFALAVYDNKLVAGGNFHSAGSVAANRIASWDGSAWSPIGSGMNGGVFALVVFGNKLIAGGGFTTAGGVDANGIAAWDGSAWSPLGSGMTANGGYVNALTVYNNKLVAGGSFNTAGGVEATNIAIWDGAAWSPLIAPDEPVVVPGVNGEVYALTVYNGKLVVGGLFSVAGDVGAGSIAQWDGAWSQLGSGMDSEVYALIVNDGKLIAGGLFTEAGGVAVNGVAAWNGSNWSPIGDPGSMSFWVGALAVYENKLVLGDSGAGLYVFDGSAWSALGSAYDIGVFALCSYDSKLVAAGFCEAVAGVAAANIAAWDGSSWSSLGPGGINGVIAALAVYDNKLIAGGGFTTAGGVPANYIAAWDGTEWSPLGSGVDRPYVRALTVYDNRLIVGGDFHKAGGGDATHIASWDGLTWSPLGSGLNNDVYALIVYDNKLITGGGFSVAGGAEASGVAAWDGSAWSALGSGTRYDDHVGGVLALALYEDKLIAGGAFTTAGGGPASCIAAWDGSAWSPLGSGVSGAIHGTLCVNALTVYEGQLIAGGVFATAGETSAICIAAWDGSSWSALGEGINDDVRDDVYALTVYDGKLIAGGFFIEEWGAVGNHVAAWDGSAWSRLGSGIYGSVVDALAVYDKSLMVGGRFSAAGNKASYNLAEWTKTSVATLLQSFAASCRGSAVELSWELSEQVPRESFVIERAERPGDFAELRGVEIAANGLRYSFTDADIEPGTMCRYRVSIAKEDASREILFETEGISIPAMPVTLFQNHPNPFNPSTIVRYYLPQSADVTLGVYDARGRLVVSLVEREKQAKGYYEVAWDGRDARGQAVASGVYFSRLRAGKLTESRKMILLK